MPVRHITEDGEDFFTGICDRCLRIGPTRDSEMKSLTDGMFVTSLDHPIICVGGCDVQHSDPAINHVRLGLDAMFNEATNPAPIVLGPFLTGLSSHTANAYAEAPSPACPECRYTGKSRWEVLADATLYDVTKPCPGCGHAV